MSSCSDWWPSSTMPTTVNSTSSSGKTARKAAWEICPASRPAWSSEYLRTTAPGTAVTRCRCWNRSTPAMHGRGRPGQAPPGPTDADARSRSPTDKAGPTVAAVLGPQVPSRSSSSISTYAGGASPGAGRPGRPPSHQPSDRSGSLVTLPLAVWGRPAVTRTYEGLHLVPRSGWESRKAAKASGVEPPVREHLERRHHLVAGAGVGHRVHGHGGDAGGGPVPARWARRSGSPSPPASSRPVGRRSRRSRPRRGRPGPRSSTSRPGSGTRWPPRRRSSPRTRRCRHG